MEPQVPPPGPPPAFPVEAELEMEDEVLSDEDLVESNGEVPEDLLANLRESQAEAQPFGKTKILEVPNYHGLLAIEYQYIGSEITESIARKVRRETRAVDGRGAGLLSSIDTLRAACKRVLCRREPEDKWMSIGGASKPVVRLDIVLSGLLNYQADNGREVVLKLFGSEHAVIQQNVILSQWLADQTRQADEDFLA